MLFGALPGRLSTSQAGVVQKKKPFATQSFI